MPYRGLWCVIGAVLLFCTSALLPFPIQSRALLRPSSLLSSSANVVDQDTVVELWKSDLDGKDINMSTQIFCNVEMNLSNVEAVGFDMDFTLAQYNEAFDLLAFEGAKRKLVENLGYPADILAFQYSADKFRRGLIIDKRRGNILKVDRHKYVRKAFHGLDELTTAMRKAIYRKQVATFTESHFANIDTLFLIVDAVLFTYLVDYRDRNPSKVSKTYEQLYADVRQSVDMCHRDGIIKDAVMANPGRYIIRDAGLVPMLRQLRMSGKKVFLLTNSMWEYTNVVMNYLIADFSNSPDASAEGRGLPAVPWEDLFDLVVVGACKPAFLKNDYLSIFKVDLDGHLHNVEDKEGLVHESLARHKRFQGGCWQDLHRLLDIGYGDRILYVGDHMYADILRSKRTLGWRTCLIIPELEHELDVAMRDASAAESIHQMRKQQFDLDEHIDKLRYLARAASGDAMRLLELQRKLEVAEAQADQLKQHLQAANEEYNRRFNKSWGQLFKAGHQDSRFAKQVMDYACLYTSKASNLGTVSPSRSFRPVQDFMPHDQYLFQSSVGED